MDCLASSSVAAELDRCDREIQQICREYEEGKVDFFTFFLTFKDWEVEKHLILREQPQITQPAPLHEESRSATAELDWFGVLA